MANPEETAASPADARLVAWNIDALLDPHAARTNLYPAYVDDTYAIRIARLRDSFPAHRHDSDESWFVHRGRMRIDYDGGSVELGAGEGVVVPVGLRHWPSCLDPGTTVLIVNRKGQRTFPDRIDEFEAAGAVDLGEKPA